jgi:hypothetical protein
MIGFLTQYRAPINMLFVLVLGCFVAARIVQSIRAQSPDPTAAARPQHFLLSAVDTAASVSIGVVWTVLIYAGPSLTQLWQGQGSAAHWWVVLLYTWIWLSFRPSAAAKSMTTLLTSIVVRTALYGLFFLVAIATLNNW